MLTFASGLGIDIAPFLSGLGVTRDQLHEYDLRIAEASRLRTWRDVAARSKDPVFGMHVAQSAEVGSFDVLDYALWSSANVGEAIGEIVRFHRVLCDAWEIELETTAETAHVRRPVATTPQEAEGWFTFLIKRARELTGRSVAPREVRFAHAAPHDTAPHTAFFDCPVRFACPISELVVDASHLALPIQTANPGLTKVLERQMTETLARLPPAEDTFMQRVRHVVGGTLHGGHPSLQSTARRLHASSRTVQRRLHHLGTTHRQVVDEVRRDLAVRLLADSRRSVTEVAFLLGFNDVSGFRRAFKQWTGKTPTCARAGAPSA